LASRSAVPIPDTQREGINEILFAGWEENLLQHVNEISASEVGHTQRMPIALNRYDKTGNYGFIEKYRCFKLEVT
jgi:hypothetical protein